MPTSLRHPHPDLRPDAGLVQVDPVTCVPRADPFDDPDWLFEPKYDGIRGLLYASASGCEIRSRRGPGFDRFQELCDRIAGVLRGTEAILDGEVVALDRRGFLAYAAFDLLWLDGRDLRLLPLAERKRHLAELLPADTGPLYKVLTVDEYGRALFKAARKMDLEGVVAKRKADPYGPETIWYTIRNPAYAHGAGQSDLFRRMGSGYRVSSPASSTRPAPVTNLARSEAR